MEQKDTESADSQSKLAVFAGWTVLAICLSVVAVRVMVTESAARQTGFRLINTGSELYSVSISLVLAAVFVFFFFVRFCAKRFTYRFTGIEPGLAVFLIAGFVSALTAPDKRAAVNHIIVVTAPALMAIVLVQLLDSRRKVKLVLAVIASLGVVFAYQCFEQFFGGSAMLIRMYEQNPEELLGQLGIEGGSFAHMLFEHRLYSRGIRGFFTTGNSGASFAILAAFAGLAMWCDSLKVKRPAASRGFALYGGLIGIIVITAGLLFTGSKGGVVAFCAAGLMFVAYYLFGGWIKRYKKSILLALIVLALAVGFLVVCYGVSQQRLPDGNSMLVRWQYWSASAKMISEHYLLGTGPGNFVHFYTRYKLPQAIETVADPHNFLLSILSQYGIFGFAGFLGMIFLPLGNVVFRFQKAERLRQVQKRFSFAGGVFIVGFICLVLLLIRPLLVDFSQSGRFMLLVSAYIFLLPVLIFIASVILFSRACGPTRNVRIMAAAAFCGIAGVLIHNLIDFALFEPGVLTAFWALFACLVASQLTVSQATVLSVRSVRNIRIVAAAGGLVVLVIVSIYLLWYPVYTVSEKIRESVSAVKGGRVQQAHKILAFASDADRLNPLPQRLNAELYIQSYQQDSSDSEYLLKAEECLREATVRNSADFKSFELLSEVYIELSEFCFSSSGRQEYLNKAQESIQAAVERYPGSGRLRVKLAQIAEQLDNKILALNNYRAAVEFEDKYRRQFKEMYPSKKVFSRLGDQKYKFALRRISELEKLRRSYKLL